MKKAAKGKPGPKPLPEDEKMVRKSIRFREPDWERLEREAGKIGLTASELVRSRALGED